MSLFLLFHPRGVFVAPPTPELVPGSGITTFADATGPARRALVPQILSQEEEDELEELLALLMMTVI